MCSGCISDTGEENGPWSVHDSQATGLARRMVMNFGMSGQQAQQKAGGRRKAVDFASVAVPPMLVRL